MRFGRATLITAIHLGLLFAHSATLASAAGEDMIAALGRIEPQGGVVRISGPSAGSAVIAKLFVEEGQVVTENQKIAILDSYPLRKAKVDRLQAELANAKLEQKRTSRLSSGGVTSQAARDAAELGVVVAQALLDGAKAEFEMAIVRSPVSGQVLEIHAHRGERVGPEGIAELGRTETMYAIAEVYETDIGDVKIGSSATVISPALPKPLHGIVESIALKIGKADVLNTDPAAKVDARVVEVDIRLDESETVRGLTNLQVEIVIAR
jgi:HlyD family secretion protein